MRLLACVIVSAFAIWFVMEAQKPELRALVATGKETVTVTNGNDEEWKSVTIILNDAAVGPVATSENWPAGEKRELPLRSFRGRLSNQAFDPEYDKVQDVTIQASGFQLGMFR